MTAAARSKPAGAAIKSTHTSAPNMPYMDIVTVQSVPQLMVSVFMECACYTASPYRLQFVEGHAVVCAHLLLHLWSLSKLGLFQYAGLRTDSHPEVPATFVQLVPSLHRAAVAERACALI